MNLDKTNYSEDTIKKMGYIVICGVMREMLTHGKRIALARELKCIRKFVEPINIDLDVDLALLKILDEPHVKLASALANHIQFEVLEVYGMINSLEDDDVVEDKSATDMGWALYWRFMFYRHHPRVRDRYINFNKVLLGAQRVLYELLKLMITGETRMGDTTYRTNYSPGRLKALMIGNENRNTIMLAELIHMLKDYELESRNLTVSR